MHDGPTADQTAFYPVVTAPYAGFELGDALAFGNGGPAGYAIPLGHSDTILYDAPIPFKSVADWRADHGERLDSALKRRGLEPPTASPTGFGYPSTKNLAAPHSDDPLLKA